MLLIGEEIIFNITKKRVAPATQDATLPADEIRVGGKVCFFCKLLQGISKKRIDFLILNSHHIGLD